MLASQQLLVVLLPWRWLTWPTVTDISRVSLSKRLKLKEFEIGGCSCASSVGLSAIAVGCSRLCHARRKIVIPLAQYSQNLKMVLLLLHSCHLIIVEWCKLTIRIHCIFADSGLLALASISSCFDSKWSCSCPVGTWSTYRSEAPDIVNVLHLSLITLKLMVVCSSRGIKHFRYLFLPFLIPPTMNCVLFIELVMICYIYIHAYNLYSFAICIIGMLLQDPMSRAAKKRSYLVLEHFMFQHLSSFNHL